MKQNPELTKYIESAPHFEKPILNHLRKLFSEACPEGEEQMKWKFAHIYYKNKGMIFMKALKERVSFGFWFTDNILNSKKLSSDAIKTQKKFDNLKKLSDLPDEKIIVEWVKTAMEEIDVGRKQSKPKKKEVLKTPNYFKEALENNNLTKKFNSMSPSHQREYLEWIISAKTDETREKRVNQAIEMINEGKSKNWKYKK